MISLEDAPPARLEALLESSTPVDVSCDRALGAAVASIPAHIRHIFIRLPGGATLHLQQDVSVERDMPTLARPSLVRHERDRPRLSGL